MIPASCTRVYCAKSRSKCFVRFPRGLKTADFESTILSPLAWHVSPITLRQSPIMPTRAIALHYPIKNRCHARAMVYPLHINAYRCRSLADFKETTSSDLRRRRPLCSRLVQLRGLLARPFAPVLPSGILRNAPWKCVWINEFLEYPAKVT